MDYRILLKTLALPPAQQLLLLVLALLLWNRYRVLSRLCLLLGILSLWLLSTPLVASRLAQAIEPSPLARESLPALEADAIVILSAYLRFNSQEFGHYSSSRHGVERLRYGAFLHRQLGLPIAISGGKLGDDWPYSLAEYMAMELEEAFGVKARWLERGSRITYENAQFTYALLQPAGKTRILLVTHAMHMRRARMLFEQAGFEVIPAPTAFVNGWSVSLRGLTPTASALRISSEAMHEILGYYYYRLLATGRPGFWQGRLNGLTHRTLSRLREES